MKKVAIIGTVGVPANYGGFETLVENMIGDNCSDGIEYTVFCSSKDNKTKLESYKGAKLKYVPLRANGAQSIPYDILSMLKSIYGYDVLLVLGVSGCVFLPFIKLLSAAKIITNIDGLEWKRDKWGGLAKKFLRFSEKLAVSFSDTVVADNQGIVDYVKEEYGITPELIAYGADHVKCEVSEKETIDVLEHYNIEKRKYAMTVCRIEPENNCEMILLAFSKSSLPIIFVGNWSKTEYGRILKEKYSNYSNIHIQDAIYNLDVLYTLRLNSKYYMHGHSAGGTNPSLVEAMYCACNILAFDIVYNRETTENKAFYFSDETEILKLLENSDSNSATMYNIACRRYKWSVVAKQYEELYK